PRLEDSFFDLGGDSLLAARALGQIRDRLRLEISLRTLFENPRLGQLASVLEAKRQGKESPRTEIECGLPRPEAGERVPRDLPLSHGQRALWFVHQLSGESPAYHVIFASRIHSPVQVDALRRAFQRLVDRHPVLRSTFPLADGAPVARIASHFEIPFEIVEAADRSEAELLRELREASETPFDLDSGPCARVCFYRNETAQYLVATFHHIVMDGWSLWVCLSELSELYESEIEGRPAALETARDFQDFLRWQAELQASPEGERQRRYWLDRLAGRIPPPLDLPADRTRPPVSTYRGASVRFALDAGITGRLKAIAGAEGATVQMGLLALFQILLFRHTGQERFLLGTLSSGRTRAEFEGVVGYLANPLVVRTELSGRASFRTALQSARDTMIDAFDHQDYPFPLLVDSLAPERDPSRSPLFQVLFVFEKAQRLEREGAPALMLGGSGERMQLGSLELEPLPIPAQHEGQFDLILLLTEREGRLEGYFDFSRDLFEASTIERMAGRYRALVAGALESPDTPIAKLPLLTESERQALISWNETSVDDPAACLHQLFEAHAARDPEALAAAF
ncbi:MAG TPA: condensation domain-containing protein, partial [Vicinamibacteria bacterium]